MSDVRAYKCARTHRVFKLWKNPNGLSSEARERASGARAVHGSARTRRKNVGVTSTRAQNFRAKIVEVMTSPAPEMMTPAALQTAHRAIIPDAKNSVRFSSAAGSFPDFSEPANTHFIGAVFSPAADVRMDARYTRAKNFRD
ncbi:hypothetical protein ACFSQU_06255 [Massilia sp. GCM10020059]|uniref:Uncharacterized protein n=1 Tax=Massilia agrisoli TaxID=2892444 RepID=A0ABS8IXQ5_9BURK|nr:hypothetical protein [Massilia agrisoli]MCC6073319.1 hypothetical protein [Massilia agrisoli]